jgi:hypothetical protein
MLLHGENAGKVCGGGMGTPNQNTDWGITYDAEKREIVFHISNNSFNPFPEFTMTNKLKEILKTASRST